jgi:hypothetical protein
VGGFQSSAENSSTDSFACHIISDFLMILRFVAAVFVLLLSLTALLAVSPLVVDDADTTEAGHLLYSIPINPVVGLRQRRTGRNFWLSMASWFRFDLNNGRCKRALPI